MCTDKEVCIFCKNNSSSSKSVEHIIPESLGGTLLTLPRGTVCDKCNNYFSLKIEGPLLGCDYFKTLRSLMLIPSKRQRLPPVSGFICGINTPGIMHPNPMGRSVLDFPEECPHDIMNYFDKNTTGAFIVPHPKHDMNDRLLARFIGKIAIEFLAYRVFSVPRWQHEAVFKKEIDSLRGFVRFDRLNGKWDLSVRPIYSPIQTFTRETGEVDQVLNELDLLYIDFKYLFLIVCIFGVEYAIGMNGPSMLPIYMDWLQDNNNVSPLYSERKF